MKTLTKKLLFVTLLAVTAFTCVLVAACTPEEVPQKTEGPETGVYYLDLGYDEYTLTLSGGDKFALVVNGENKDGLYTLNGEKLDLTFAKTDDGVINAELKNDAVTLSYKGDKMTFLKKVIYTVTFDSDGGSEIKTAAVVNGKSVAKPESDPSKPDFVFVGWFADSAKTVPYAFNTPVTANTTVYAKWAAKTVGERQYEVKFDLGYTGAEAIPSAKTIGGALHLLPQPAERSGYTFKGWWFSQTEKADELTYAVTADTVFEESTTLFAVWQQTTEKLSAPDASVNSQGVSWNAVTGGVREYVIDIVGPDGKKVAGFDNKRNNGTTSEIVDFDGLEAGVYVVSVTAIASDQSKNSDTTVRYFTNKGLARVSLFEVAEPSLLLFNNVEHAEGYYITVECGDSRHKHEYVYNGASTNYNFAGCAMKEGGIMFTVTAIADGYASSTSETFVVERTLGDMSELKFDAATETVTWDSVPFATEYVVTVNGGEEFSVGASTSLCLKNYAAQEGGLSVKVYPKTTGYNSSAAVEAKFTKTNLVAPQGVSLDNDGLLSWTAVENATSYEVKVGGGDPITVTEASADLSELLADIGLGEFKIYVRALGATDSLWSDPFSFSTKDMVTKLTYSSGVFSWNRVFVDDYYSGYTLKINDGELIVLSDSAITSYNVTLQEGVNTLQVRRGGRYDDMPWSTLKVTAYAITFTNYYGDGVPAQYKAVGDKITLPTASRTNYDFNGWYNVPGGSAANGKKYEETVFSGNGSITLYADFKPSKFTIKFDFAENLGGIPTQEKEGEVYYMESYKFPVPTNSDGTKAFGGWYSLPDAGGNRYTDEKGNSLKVWSLSTKDNMVYAYWQDQILDYELMSVTGFSDPVYAVKAGANIGIRSEVTIPEKYRGVQVGMIAPSAFENARNLRILNIPDSIQVISEAAPFPDDWNKDFAKVNVYHVEGNRNIRFGSVDGVLIDYGAIDAQLAGTAVPEVRYVPVAKDGSFTIPDGVEVIYAYSFQNSHISELIIPASVVTVEGRAFYDCKNLTKITFLAPKIGEAERDLTLQPDAFYGAKITEIEVPKRIASMSLNTYGGNSLSFGSGVKVNIQNGGRYYSSVDGVIYNADKTVLIYAPKASDSTQTFEIPFGVSSIESGAFSQANFETVKIPSTVTDIREGAFYGTDVRNIIFGGESLSGKVTIGKNAFAEAGYLRSLTFEAGSNVSEIGESAFEGCSNLAEAVMPATLETVGDAAFRNSGLRSISFANNDVRKLTFGNEVFRGCASLTTFTVSKNMVNLPDFGGCDNLSDIVVPDDNPNLSSEDGVVYNKQKTELYYYPRGKQDTEFVIPDSVEVVRYSVFEGNSYIQKVTVGAKVREIGAYAFNNCTALKNIVFNNTVNFQILKYAFRNTGFETLALPDKATSIGEYAFAEMKNLTTFTIGSNVTAIGGYAFSNDHLLAGGDDGFVIPASVKEIGEYAFALSENLKNVRFADSAQVEKIGDYAFWGTKITSVEIPASVKEIGAYAFIDMALKYGDPDVAEDGVLESVTFKAGSKLEKIGAHAFYGAKITELEIPKSVKAISPLAFANCKLLSTLTFETGGTENLTLGAYEYELNDNGYVRAEYGEVFKNTAITSVTIPARVTVMGDGIFKDCAGLETVTFEAGGKLENIPNKAFINCTRLSSVTNIPKTVGNQSAVGLGNEETIFNRAAIGESAFSGCYNLTTVTFEQGGTASFTVGPEAFKNCTRLTSITFYGNFSDYSAYRAYWYAIASDSFSGCTSLTAINIGKENSVYASFEGVLYTPNYETLEKCPSGVKAITVHDSAKNIKKGAFNGCTELTSLTFPATLGLDVSVLDSLANLKEITVTGEGGNYSSQGGVLYNGDKTSLIYYPKGLTATSFEIPASVTTIEEKAFYGNTVLQTITFAERTLDLAVGEYAFAESNLASISLPASLTELGDYAFYNCGYLSELIFADGCKITKLPDHALWNCSELTSIRIPAKVTEIQKAGTLTKDYKDDPDQYEDGIFYGCDSLETITFEEGSVCESIGNGAFTDLRWSLKRLELPDSVKTIGDSVCFTGAGEWSSGSFNYLEYVRLPANVETIGARAFKSATYAQFENTDLSKLISVGLDAFYQAGTTSKEDYSTIGFDVKFSDTLKSIGERAFKESGIRGNVTISVTLTEIGDEAFGSCDQLTSANLPASATLGDDIFNDCTMLSSVTIADGIKTIPKGTFGGCQSLTSVTVPQSVIGFGDSCFYNTRIENFELPGQVTSIPKQFFKDNTALTSFTMHGNVSSIGESAFEGCTGLAHILVKNVEETAGEVVLPRSVNQLGNKAFKNCSSLPNVKVPTLITKLPDEVFYGCTSFVNYEIPSHITELGSGCLAGVPFTTFVLPEKLTTLPANFFKGNTGLQKVILHDKVTSIGAGAFSGCTGLQLVTVKGEEDATVSNLPALVTSVSDSLFSGCTSLTAIALTDKITSIGSSAFQGTALTSIDIPATVTSIGGSAFKNCASLTAINFNEFGDETAVKTSLTSIGSSAFEGCALLANVILPATVSELGSAAFKGCKALTAITVPEAVTSLAESVFEESGLTSVTLSSNITVISRYAFRNCASLASVAIPAKVTRVNSEAFSGCSNLETVTFEKDILRDEYGYPLYDGTPSSAIMLIEGKAFINCAKLGSIVIPDFVTNLSANTFEGCMSLTSVTFGRDLRYISAEAFKGCALLDNLTLTANISSIDKTAFAGCTALTTINSEDNKNFSYENGAMYDFDKKVLKFYTADQSGSVTVKDGVEELGSHLFENMAQVTGIILPASLKTIGEYAFQGTGISGIEIPAGVTALPGYVFRNCASLTSVTLPEGLISIDTEAFAGCTSLTSLKIPSTVNSLIDDAFDNSGITAIDFTGNKTYAFKNGAIYDANMTQIKFILPTTSGTFVIESGVTIGYEGSYVYDYYLFKNTGIDTIIVKKGAILGKYALYGISGKTVKFENTEAEVNALKGTLWHNYIIGKYSYEGKPASVVYGYVEETTP